MPPDAKPLRLFYGADEVYALEKPLHVLQPPDPPGDDFASVLSVHYSPDSRLIFTTHVSGHMNRLVYKYLDTTEGTRGERKRKRRSLFSHSDFSRPRVLRNRGRRRRAAYRSLAANSELRTLHPPNVTGVVKSLRFSPDGKMLVAIYQGKRLADSSTVLWNTVSWTSKTIGGYGSAAFSRDSQMLALGGPEIKLPNYANRPDAKAKTPCDVTALTFSPDGKMLAAGCFEGTLRILRLTP